MPDATYKRFLFKITVVMAALVALVLAAAFGWKPVLIAYHKHRLAGVVDPARRSSSVEEGWRRMAEMERSREELARLGYFAKREFRVTYVGSEEELGAFRILLASLLVGKWHAVSYLYDPPRLVVYARPRDMPAVEDFFVGAGLSPAQFELDRLRVIVEAHVEVLQEVHAQDAVEPERRVERMTDHLQVAHGFSEERDLGDSCLEKRSRARDADELRVWFFPRIETYLLGQLGAHDAEAGAGVEHHLAEALRAVPQEHGKMNEIAAPDSDGDAHSTTTMPGGTIGPVKKA
jgi:hypothetical protein